MQIYQAEANAGPISVQAHKQNVNTLYICDFMCIQGLQFSSASRPYYTKLRKVRKLRVKISQPWDE